LERRTSRKAGKPQDLLAQRHEGAKKGNPGAGIQNPEGFELIVMLAVF
jgi:hypothetical protein